MSWREPVERGRWGGSGVNSWGNVECRQGTGDRPREEKQHPSRNRRQELSSEALVFFFISDRSIWGYLGVSQYDARTFFTWAGDHPYHHQSHLSSLGWLEKLVLRRVMGCSNAPFPPLLIRGLGHQPSNPRQTLGYTLSF